MAAMFEAGKSPDQQQRIPTGTVGKHRASHLKLYTETLWHVKQRLQ